MAARTYGLAQRVARSAMRRGAILAWLALCAACGGLPEPASGETELDTLSREAKRKVSIGTCPPPKVPADQPELIGWDQGSRGTLHAIASQGVPVVYFRALGCDITLELLSDCVDKTHKYSYSRSQGEASRSASNELGLYSDFPVGAGGLRARLSGGEEVRAQIFEVGVQRIEIGADIHMADLRGDCARATHVVAAIHRGAFASLQPRRPPSAGVSPCSAPARTLRPARDSACSTVGESIRPATTQPTRSRRAVTRPCGSS